MSSDEPQRWPVRDSRDRYRGDWVVALREDTVERPGHPDEPFSRLVVEHPGAVMALAVDEDERVCCIRQYRHAVGERLVELPAGICDSDKEPLLETAKRELREEVELQAREWRPLLSVFPSAGITSEVHHLFLARGLSPAGRGEFAMEHEEADIEVVWVPMAGLLDDVLAGRVRESPTAVAVLAYDVLKRRGEL
ncbi:MAG: NUDIX hydrolase [Actinomycetota bacterium]|nr:NUDIX hydrolase [Actinomycetota bacterium]